MEKKSDEDIRGANDKRLREGTSEKEIKSAVTNLRMERGLEKTSDRGIIWRRLLHKNA